MDPEKLITRYFHNLLTDEEFCQLQDWLRADPTHVEIFVKASFLNRTLGDFVRGECIQENIQKHSPDFDIFTDLNDDQEIWEALLDEERIAPTLETIVSPKPSQPVSESKPKPIEETPSQSKPVGKLWPTISLITSLAAMILLLLGYVSYLHSHRVVATLGPSLHAKWTHIPEVNELRPGTRELREGVAEIQFIQGARILVQAPCILNLRSDNRMELLSGTLTAEVPEQARGFRVETPWSNITDYGTAFGVSLDSHQNADIHVFEGEVGLQSTVQNKRNNPVLLKQGQNAHVNPKEGVGVGQAKSNAHQYLRALPDSNQLGIPGQSLNLADLVGGGNGFGTGQRVADNDEAKGTLNLMTGRLNDPARPEDGLDPSKRYDYLHYPGTHQYVPVPELRLIDGVFVPDGGAEAVVVSSQGDCFDACPDTDGQFKWNITNGWRYRDLRDDPGRNNAHMARACGISMHANSGITFDLQAVTESMPGVRVSTFAAKVGVPLTYSPDISEIDIWILVDGQARFSVQDVRYPRQEAVEVELLPTDRFLTLMVTDSQTQSNATRQSSMDWCFWENPILTMTFMQNPMNSSFVSPAAR